MSKLKLVNIHKIYNKKNNPVRALKGVSLEFEKSEFVSILGPSGCGKTTLLNIVGGLDRYDDGDLIINGLSTKLFKDKDWDAYRNRSIGFVFQNYNLISHQTVLQNVEISMTISGVSVKDRRKRAKEALISVGLEDQIKKKPNQLSGGQMQRVAIARALVNNPDIILADEPTGAIDSHTSEQIMNLLKDISKTRLVIMVTHNAKMAKKYSTRVINLLDGEIQDDSNPLVKDTDIQENTDTDSKKENFKKTSMSLGTATALSFRNLLTKKGRTIITAFAGSIGIIGVALVLALSNGLSGYIDNMQSEALSGFPISITTGVQSVDFTDRRMEAMAEEESELGKFTDDNIIYRYDSSANTVRHTNIFTQEYLDYILELEQEVPGTVNTIVYSRGVSINILAKGEDSVIKYSTSSRGSIMQAMTGSQYWQEMPDDHEFILSLYDLIGEGSRMPETMNEIILVVDEYNRIDENFFQKLGIFTNAESYTMEDFIGKTILKMIPNDDYYLKNEDGNFIVIDSSQYNDLYESDKGLALTITGVLRLKENAGSSFLSTGLVYTTSLTDYCVDNAKNSAVALAQAEADFDVVLGIPFVNDALREQKMLSLGADTTPIGINIYPKDFASKDSIKQYLDEYNTGKEDVDNIVYTDLAETITGMIGTLLNTITYVLIGFAAISLLVSSIMIGIITYVSVIERTKEIGILRSVGARKKDVSRVFNAESLIIGFVSGILGVGLSYLLIIPINIIIERIVSISEIANLTMVAAIVLVLGSMALTFIAGLIPSRMAAKKDPVVALRTE